MVQLKIDTLRVAGLVGGGTGNSVIDAVIIAEAQEAISSAQR